MAGAGALAQRLASWPSLTAVIRASTINPAVAAAIDQVLATCQKFNIPCGHPHVDAGNVERILNQGFHWLMPAPVRSFRALELGP